MQIIRFINFFVILLLLISCRTGNTSSDSAETGTRTPVTVTNPVIKDMVDTIELNATSSFLLKTGVKAPITGYLQEVNVKPGETVRKGVLLFIIRSKEANSLGNSINKIDSSFHFSGVVKVSAPGSGFIAQLSFQAGDYVQEGELLAEINDLKSLVFLLDLPYELKPFIPQNKEVSLILPDGQKIRGDISSSIPAVDPASQTQRYFIRLKNYNTIPENLIARVPFILHKKINAVTLPKEAVLTNEQQTQFWIMKMKDSVVAVKTPVKKGIETSSEVEILSPVLSVHDKIIVKGNYGLPDTAKVIIEK